MKGADACFLVHSQNVNEIYLFYASKLQQLVSFAVISWDFFVFPPNSLKRLSRLIERVAQCLYLTSPKIAESASRNWVDQRHWGKGQEISPLSGVSCAFYWHSTEGFRDRKIKCEWEGCRRGRQRPPVPVEYFPSPASLMLQGSALASAK